MPLKVVSTLETSTKQDAFTITDLATEFGLTTRTIRHYEDKDLLRPRRQGTARIYSRRDRARLHLILRGRRLGFSLADIREMLDLYDLGDGQVEQLKLILQKSRQRITELQEQAGDIAEMISELEEGCGQIEAILQAGGMTSQSD